MTSAGAALADFNARHAGPLDKLRMAVWMAGGIASLALVAGIGIWGYKVVKREMFGPPLVTAPAGEMRVLPADPGGEQAPNQGLAVNAIPAAGEVAPPSDVLTLAPPVPGLAPEDMEVVQTRAEEGEVLPAATAGTSLAVTGVTATAALEAPPPAAVADPGTASDPALTVPTDRPMTAEEVIAFADRIAAGAAAMAPVTPAPDAPPVETALAPVPGPSPVSEAAPALAIIPADVPGVAIAIRPPARPAGATLIAAATSAPAPGAEASAPAAQPVALTTDIPPGTPLVQLGAFDSAEVAAREWERLNGLFGEFLAGHERVIQQAESGGQTFYRLRARGFADLADARRLCAALVAENAQCIPVVTR